MENNRTLNEDEFVKLLIAQDEFTKNINKIKENKEYYDNFSDYDNVDKTNVENLVKYINFLHIQIIALTDERIKEMNMIINLNKRKFKYLYDSYNTDGEDDVEKQDEDDEE